MKKALVIILSFIMILVMIPVSTGVAETQKDYVQHGSGGEHTFTYWTLKDNVLRVYGHIFGDTYSMSENGWLGYTGKGVGTTPTVYTNKNFSDVIYRIRIDMQSIGGKAFYECNLVNEVYITSSTITDVGKDAFLGIGSTATPCNLVFRYGKWPITETINGEKCTFTDTGLIYWAGGVFKAGNGTKEYPWHIGKTESDDVIAYISGTDLIIDGSGEMRDFDLDESKKPFWYEQRDTIEEVYIGNEVNSIGNNAFYNNSLIDKYTLKKINFENNSTLVTIGEMAFDGCIQLEELVMPDSVKTIQSSAFDACKKVSNLVISSNLTSVGDNAFFNLTGLKTVTFNGFVPNNIYFLSSSNQAALYMPLDYLATDKPSSSSMKWHGANFNLIPSGTAEHPWYIGKPASGSNVPTSKAQAYISGTDLIITGTGETIDFGEGGLVTDIDKIPWKASATSITNVRISKEIKKIGENSFTGIGASPASPSNIEMPGNMITRTPGATTFSFKEGTFNASGYCTMTFDSKGGSEVSSVTVGPLEEYVVSEPADPTKAGYLFDGWYQTTEDDLWDFNESLATNTTLNAKWTQSYKATVKLDGGTVSDAPANWVAVSDGYAKDFRVNTSYTDILSEWNGKITKSGYTFAGWDVSAGTLATDTSFTAKWKQNSTGGYFYIPPVDNKKNDEKLKEAEEKAKLKEEILFAQVEASSKLYKLNGKTAIKITWNIENSDLKLADLDNYEIYRSTKKNSGYGKTPYFTSSKPDYGYYVNNKGLKNGKTYYYKVRGFKVIDGEKYYTPWSTKCWRTVK